MSKKLDIDNNIELWVPVFNAFLRKEVFTCPRCGSDKLNSDYLINENHVGYLAITCTNCGKTGYMSRLSFPADFK